LRALQLSGNQDPVCLHGLLPLRVLKDRRDRLPSFRTAATVLIGVFFTMPGVPLRGQTAPAFEVAVIKPNNLPPRERSGTMVCSGKRFYTHARTVHSMLRWMYKTDPLEIEGLPTWAGNDGQVYEFEGRATEDLTEARCQSMVQAMFADRLKLKVRWVSRETPVLALVRGKGDLKMERVTETDPPNSVNFRYAGAPMQMFPASQKGWTMDDLARALTIARLSRPIYNRTGIEGEYKFSMSLRPSGFDYDGDDATTAVQRLGLKLELRTETLPFLVVDHIERPDGN
jgi:uncharacterized protein (TIGR03435 family)